MENKIGFKPLGQRVLVEKYNPEVSEKEQVQVSEGVSIQVDKLESVGGLLIPKKETEEISEDFKKNSGKILALGTGLSKDALDNLSIGTTITFQNPHTITYKGTDYYVVHENNIHLIVEE